MNFKPFTGPGSTPARRKFWAQAIAAVEASRKREGRHVSVTEHDGKGTFINVADTSARRSGVVPPPVDCHPSNLCTLDLSFTSAIYNVSQTGLSITPNVCNTIGWNGEWRENCIGDDCGNITKYCTIEASCVCGVRFEWIEIVGSHEARVRIILNKITGDGTLPDGWYLWSVADAYDDETHCFWESAVCFSFPCTCVFLGSDDSIFDTDFFVSVPMIEDPNFPCSGDATLDLTFHPC